MPKRRPSAPPSEERRKNVTLREALDELVLHVREVANNVDDMTAEQIDYAQQRLEWLADEVWRIAVERGGTGI